MSAVDAIAVLDYGSQYTQLIARRIREMSVYSEILPPTVSLESLRAAGYKGIILSGGPSSVYEEQAPVAPTALFDLGVPVLGICYGMQIMAYLLGGRVVPVDRREYGKAVVQLHAPSALLRGITPERRSAGRLDEPRRYGAGSPARASRSLPPPTTARWPRWPTMNADSTPCSSIPK